MRALNANHHPKTEQDSMAKTHLTMNQNRNKRPHEYFAVSHANYNEQTKTRNSARTFYDLSFFVQVFINAIFKSMRNIEPIIFVECDVSI